MAGKIVVIGIVCLLVLLFLMVVPVGLWISAIAYRLNLTR